MGLEEYLSEDLIATDLKGNDKYLCDNYFLVAGILGIAVLLDLNGDDLYQTNRPGLAFSLYGCCHLIIIT